MFSKRRNLVIKSNFVYDDAEALVQTQRACLFNLTLTLSDRNSFRAITHLLDYSKVNTEICYKRINVNINGNTAHSYNRMVTKMKKLGYNLNVIKWLYYNMNGRDPEYAKIVYDYAPSLGYCDMVKQIKEFEILNLVVWKEKVPPMDCRMNLLLFEKYQKQKFNCPAIKISLSLDFLLPILSGFPQDKLDSLTKLIIEEPTGTTYSVETAQEV